MVSQSDMDRIVHDAIFVATTDPPEFKTEMVVSDLSEKEASSGPLAVRKAVVHVYMYEWDSSC